MILSAFIILVALGIAYMHYLQGVFTSAISLGCAVVATLVAFGYYESGVNAMSQNGFADYAGGLMLIVLFAVTYLVLRVAADALVPGNITLPLYADKVGSALFGLAAGVLGAGVIAVGVQLMPLGPSIAGYAPYELQDRTVIVPAEAAGKRRGVDSGVTDELKEDTFQNRSSLLLPADTLTLGLVKTASDGAFSGSQPFSAVHADLPAEAFFARLGAEHGEKHVALNTSKGNNATVAGIYLLPSAPTALDSEIGDVRPNKTSITYKPSSQDTLIVVRAGFGDNAADKDGYVRMTPAAARLVIGDQQFLPIGTMEGTSFIGLNRPDDLLPLVFANGSRSADLVYALPKSVADTLVKSTPDEQTPMFIELKLFGRVKLAGIKVESYASAPKGAVIARKSFSPLGKAMPAPVK